MRRFSAMLVLTVTLVAASPAAAADVATGARVAEQWCAHCHIIAPAQSGAVQPGPPSFQAIAQSGPAGDALRAFLARPHGAMPDLALTRSEIDDLMAYIGTLR